MVVELRCSRCDTRVSGRYDLCPVCTLTGESRRLFQHFLEARGNLKEVQRRLGVSYPTVRARIEELFQGLSARRRHPLEILDDLHAGVLGVEEAVELLGGSPMEKGSEPCDE